MIKRFIDKKKEAEGKIKKILNSFIKETGTTINFVSAKTKKNVGFTQQKEELIVEIILKN